MPESQATDIESPATQPIQPSNQDPSTSPTEPAESEPQAAKRRAVDGDDVDVDEKGTVTMPFLTFQKRLNRAVRSHLKEAFGSEDPKEIEQQYRKGKEAHEKLEKTRLAQLSEMEKLREKIAEYEERVEEAESTMQSVQLEKLASKGEALVTSIASKYIAGDYVEDAVAVYHRKLTKLDDDELEGLSAADVEQHFKDYAERKQAFAKRPKQQRSEPASTGTNPNYRPSQVTPNNGGKTPKPGQPNSMTRAEWEEYKSKHGISY